MRHSELATVKSGDIHFDDDVPHIHLDGRHTKHRMENKIPIAKNLQEPLRLWCAEQHLLPGEHLFGWPCHGPRILRDDCLEAGLNFVDEEGARLDRRSFRATHARLLQEAGVDIPDIFLFMNIHFEDNKGRKKSLKNHAEAVDRFPDFMPTE